MEFVSRYQSHQPDEQGFVTYSAQEHHVWQLLFKRQKALLPQRACDEFLQGLATLGYLENEIPQLPMVSQRLLAATGWQVAPVAALISAREFFTLLAQKKFPVATFIRVEEELDYLKEPDIFHELFGHCPMLMHPLFADFVHQYAQLVLTFPESEWPLLQRLFWFTVEFGLIKTPQGLRAYGGGILSSISETVYSVESPVPLRAMFEPLVVFRTPYRIDQLQAVYFVIDHYAALYDLTADQLKQGMQKAHELGEYPPFFMVGKNNPNIHIHAC